MEDTKIRKELDQIGLKNLGEIKHNLTPALLVEEALANGEGVFTDTGAFRVVTGKFTGRSPKDRFIVRRRSIEKQIAWGDVNMPIEADVFERLYDKVMAYLEGKKVYVFDGLAGADVQYQMQARIVNEYAHQNLFMHQLLVRPSKEKIGYYVPELHMVCAPGFKCDPEIDGVNSDAAIILDLEKRLILIVGSSYCGEMKKAIFSSMNYFLPQRNVLSMHCSANMDPESGNVALFFGLSGTGKTTLSADPARKLIGDDEHGWSNSGVFNIEGGCYAKAIRLNREQEPEIFDAIKFGSVVENVEFFPNSRKVDFYDGNLTENTRAAYPIEYIPNAQLNGRGGIPKTVIFLTADAFGVLPPIAKLNTLQAMYHLLSGYTSKLAGTERGVTEPQATFSTCFGEPFLPLDPMVYAKMLAEKIEKYNVNVYLLNTGWVGGPYGIGNRIKLSYTRTLVSAALNGDLENVEFEQHPVFKVFMPKSCPGIDAEILNPMNLWFDKDAYMKQAKMLGQKFIDNFARFESAPNFVVQAGPVVD